jgi:hypothetical protein
MLDKFVLEQSIIYEEQEEHESPQNDFSRNRGFLSQPRSVQIKLEK